MKSSSRRGVLPKSYIADASLSILRDPVVHVHKLGQLIELCDLNAKSDEADKASAAAKARAEQMKRNPQTSHFALAAVAEVLQDIVPSYKVSLKTQQQGNQQLSKDLKQMRAFELQVMQYTTIYTKLLSTLAAPLLKQSKHNVDPSSRRVQLAVTALSCAAKLVASSNLMEQPKVIAHLVALVVPRCTSPHQDVSERCCDAVRTILSRRTVDHLSAQVVFSLVKAIQKKQNKRGKYSRIRPEVLDLFLELSLRQPRRHASAPPPKKKRKKNASFEKDLKKDLQKGGLDAQTEAENQKHTSDVLMQVCRTYLSILTDRNCGELLPSVLRGFTRFAHLINVDLLLDLLTTLQDAVCDNPRLKLDVFLRSVVSLFDTLQSCDMLIKLDLRPTHSRLLDRIVELAIPRNHYGCAELAAQVMVALVVAKTDALVLRLFAEALSTVAVHIPRHVAEPITVAIERTGLRALLEKQSALSVTDPTRRCTGLNPALMDDDVEAEDEETKADKDNKNSLAAATRVHQHVSPEWLSSLHRLLPSTSKPKTRKRSRRGKGKDGSQPKADPNSVECEDLGTISFPHAKRRKAPSAAQAPSKSSRKKKRKKTGKPSSES